jgi:hypothetical protein
LAITTKSRFPESVQLMATHGRNAALDVLASKLHRTKRKLARQGRDCRWTGMLDTLRNNVAVAEARVAHIECQREAAFGGI